MTFVVEHMPRDIVARVATPARELAAATSIERTALADAEAASIERSLVAHRGNVAAAARELGVARSTIYRKLRRS